MNVIKSKIMNMYLSVKNSTDIEYEFKKEHSFISRLAQGVEIRKRFPNFCPTIVETKDPQADWQQLPKQKYLLPEALGIEQFRFYMRDLLNLNDYETHGTHYEGRSDQIGDGTASSDAATKDRCGDGSKVAGSSGTSGDSSSSEPKEPSQENGLRNGADRRGAAVNQLSLTMCEMKNQQANSSEEAQTQTQNEDGRIPARRALHLYAGNTLIRETSISMGGLYEKYRDKDLFLYIALTEHVR